MPAMPVTAPIPAPGRYDARKATRLQYTQRLADLGWAALADDERRWLDRLYWGDAPHWPCLITSTVYDDGAGAEAEVAVPALGEGHTSVRTAPIVQTKPDPEPAPGRQSFRDFWQWWIAEGRPALTADGKVRLGGLAGAPLLKVVQRKEPRRAPARPR